MNSYKKQQQQQTNKNWEEVWALFLAVARAKLEFHINQ